MAETSRQPVASSRRVVLGTLSASARSRLEDELHELWSEFFVGLSREQFVATHLFDDTRLQLVYGRDGELAGFANINASLLQDEGKTHLVMHCGAFTRLRYDAVRTLIFRGAREFLRLRLRHPRTPMAYVGVMTSPVAYRLFGWAGVDVYPAPNAVAPPHVERLLGALAERRRIPVDPDDPWLAEFAVKQRDPTGLKESRCVRRGNRHVDFFVQRAPQWHQGWSLLAWMPLTTVNVVGGLLRLIFKKRR
ncbi:MAG: hypothetical protein AAF799_43065 [Myxococcota bacterium]